MTSSAGEGAAPGFPSAVVDRGLGCLLGLAVGDALGTTLEFRGRDECPALTDMVGGGVFGLAPGERQIAGALWGRSRIPDAWLHRLAWRREIEDRARALLARPG